MSYDPLAYTLARNEILSLSQLLAHEFPSGGSLTTGAIIIAILFGLAYPIGYFVGACVGEMVEIVCLIFGLEPPFDE